MDNMTLYYMGTLDYKVVGNDWSDLDDSLN